MAEQAVQEGEGDRYSEGDHYSTPNLDSTPESAPDRDGAPGGGSAPGRVSAPGEGSKKTRKRKEQRKRAKARALMAPNQEDGVQASPNQEAGARASPNQVASAGRRNGSPSSAPLTWEDFRRSLCFEFGEREVREWETKRAGGANHSREPEEDNEAFVGRSKFSLWMSKPGKDCKVFFLGSAEGVHRGSGETAGGVARPPVQGRGYPGLPGADLGGHPAPGKDADHPAGPHQGPGRRRR